MRGTLYIVATPIGNLEDITLRALRILKEVHVIACEDTRRTRILLDHYGIEKALISFFEHNEVRRISDLLGRLEHGDSVAVVSDAGTPTISDPAFKLVREAAEKGFTVVTVPGVSAAIAALAVSGLPTDAFVFEGFLPQKKGRQTAWKRLALEDRTIILYESPHRIEKTLAEIAAALGDRPVVVARELTKKFEEVLRGSATAMMSHFKTHTPRGEFVILVAGKRYADKLLRQTPPEE